MGGAAYRTFGLSDTGPLGLSCSQKGLTLAGVPLLRQAEHGFVPHSSLEIGRLLSAAYDIDADVTSVMAGLEVVACALNGGDTVRAMIAAAQLKLPALDWDGAVRIARAEEALQKYSRNQPRDWHGRWTTGGAGGPVINPQPVSFRPSGQSAEAPPPTKPQSDDAESGAPSPFELPKDWVTLPPGQRIDELGDLLEWIANANPKDERAIRAEIKRYYYDVGDIRGGNALNQALSEVLYFGPLERKDREEILQAYDPYTREDPAVIGQMYRDLAALGILSLPAMLPADVAVSEAIAADPVWELGWARRGQIIEDRLGRNLPRSFRIIDVWDGALATSIKSVDLNAAVYQDAARLSSRLGRYVEQLSEFNIEDFPSLTMDAPGRNWVGRVLHLAVPQGSVTAVQRQVIDAIRMRALQEHGIDVIVTEL